MPYTVAYEGAGTKRHEFDTYFRLLANRGIEWTDTERVPEPGTQNRWVYVWQDAAEAQSFCDSISRETRDDNAQVHEVNEATPPKSWGNLFPASSQPPCDSSSFSTGDSSQQPLN